MQRRRNILMLGAALALSLASVRSEAAVQTYTSSSPPLFIPDGSPGTAQTDTIMVLDSGLINDINVTLTLMLPELADITVELTDPSGMLANGRAFPGWISAVGPDITWLPTLRSSGARMYRFSPSR